MDINKLSECQIRQLFQCSDTSCQCHKSNGNVHCPCHDDENPSMSLKKENGTVVIHCFASCNQDSVFQAVVERAESQYGNNGNGSKHQNVTHNSINNLYERSTLTAKDIEKIKQYFKIRNIEIDDDTINQIGLKVNRYKEKTYIVYPIRNTQNELVQLGRIEVDDQGNKIGKTLLGTYEGDRATIFNEGHDTCFIFEGCSYSHLPSYIPP